MTTALSNRQKKQLRAQAHKLNPVVEVGQKGCTEPVLAEINRALEDHELIKIKVRCDDQAELKSNLDLIVGQTKGELIQVIGHTIVFYRRNLEEPKIKIAGI